MDENVVFLPRRECGESPYRFRARWLEWREQRGWDLELGRPKEDEAANLARQIFRELAS